MSKGKVQSKCNKNFSGKFNIQVKQPKEVRMVRTSMNLEKFIRIYEYIYTYLVRVVDFCLFIYFYLLYNLLLY